MVSFTNSKVLTLPANSSYVGTWDQPTNANWQIVDAALGQVAVINLNNSPVTLNAAQFGCAGIVLRSTLTGNVPITFPTTFTGMYVIKNECTGSSAFIVTLLTTFPGANVISAPPGMAIDVFNEGASLFYRSLGPIGSYLDFAGSSLPAWVSACSVPPYLHCDGTTFSSATFPILADILGGTALPDTRGRSRFNVNSGTGRISTAVSGINGDTKFAAGGDQWSQTHNHPITITDPGHVHTQIGTNTLSGAGLGAGAASGATTNTGSATTGITAVSANFASGNSQNMPPAYIGGITLIRAG